MRNGGQVTRSRRLSLFRQCGIYGATKQCPLHVNSSRPIPAARTKGWRVVRTGSDRTPVPTVVTKTQSGKWQKLAALPDDKFGTLVEHAGACVEGNEIEE